MSEKTGISWTRSTFNPWWGCAKVSPGCDFCYAERDSKRYGFDVWGSTAPRRFFGEKHWAEPLKWNREAQEMGDRWPVFCASMADHLEARGDLNVWRERLYKELIPATPALTWLLLTKRPENAEALMPPDWLVPGLWPRNVWFGFTAEDQERFDVRWPHAERVPSPILWCSYEPALGPIDFRTALPRLSWMIVGGESGFGARPMEMAWARSARDQCRAAGVAFFYKQGGTSNRCQYSAKGGCLDCTPEDLRVREWPS